MEPLVQSFTKNLSPCTGCGNSAVDYFIEQKTKGAKVTFILQIEANGDDLIQAIQSDRTTWKVISGNPARQQQAVPAQIQGSTFQRTTTQPTPNG